MLTSSASPLNVLLNELYKNKQLVKQITCWADKLLLGKNGHHYEWHVKGSDMLSSVVTKLIEGEIIFKKDKSEFPNFIYMRIRSEISNMFKKEKKVTRITYEVNEPENEDQENSDNEVPLIEDLIINPSEIVLDKKIFDLIEYRSVAYEIFQDLPEEFLVFDGVCKGLKPRQIASDLGISAKIVHNTKKRIIRILKDWFLRNKRNRSLSRCRRSSNKPNNKNGGPKCTQS